MQKKKQIAHQKGEVGNKLGYIKKKNMKHFFAIILSFIFTGTGIACDCNWAGDFLTAGVKQNLVVKVKIIGHHKHHQDINEKMTVEIIEKYKGKETRKTITVWGDNGMECRPYVDYFK